MIYHVWQIYECFVENSLPQEKSHHCGDAACNLCLPTCLLKAISCTPCAYLKHMLSQQEPQIWWLEYWIYCCWSNLSHLTHQNMMRNCYIWKTKKNIIQSHLYIFLQKCIYHNFLSTIASPEGPPVLLPKVVQKGKIFLTGVVQT